MIPLPVPYRSNPAPFRIGGEPKIINAYAETGADDNKANAMLMPCAGMKTFGSALAGPSRGMIYAEDDGVVYSVNGIQIYSIVEAGTATSLGLIGGTSQCSLARNDAEPQQIAILSDGKVYYIEEGALSYKIYSISNTDGSETLIQPEDITFCGGRFILGLENGRFYWTGINSKEITGLSFATAEGSPDGLTAVHGQVDILFLIGPQSTEIWGLTADQDAPFQRIGSSYLNIGSVAKHTVRSFNNGVAMVGSDNVCYLINQGGSYTPFSSNEVSRLIEADTNREGIVAFTHERGQNKFYTLQGTGWTREYNALTGTWADRRDINKTDWHIINSVKAWGKKIFGDSATGQLFEADYALFTDNSNPMEWGFETNVNHDSPDGLVFGKVALDVETGDGISMSEAGQVMFSRSKDNGRTWIGPRHLSLGKTGEYRKRVRTNRIGRCGEKGMTFRWIITDPVIRAVAGFYGDVKGVRL